VFLFSTSLLFNVDVFCCVFTFMVPGFNGLSGSIALFFGAENVVALFGRSGSFLMRASLCDFSFSTFKQLSSFVAKSFSSATLGV